MINIENLENRWAELASKSKTKEEIEETLILAKKIETERAKEYKGLIDELSEVGLKISSIWDLVNTKARYPVAIPLLLKYLPLVKSIKNKEGIVRALTVPEAKGKATKLLVLEYLSLPKEMENLKWLIGNAINVTITKNEIDEIFPIVLNAENGHTRQMFISALGKIKSEKVKQVLLQLSEDENKIIRDEAQKALKKIT